MDPVGLARYAYDVTRANDQGRFAADIMMPPGVCNEMASRMATSRPGRVCDDYSHNAWQSFRQLASSAAGPLEVLGTWNKRQGNGSIPAIMVETQFMTRAGQLQAMKMELVEVDGRLYLFSVHLTPLGCRGRTAC